ncbi:MAG: hypothetical protein L0Z55_04200 [Planctomycetes bacterium]|nr:hypothetical protein [Planctomycetota bacterium]
MFSKFRFSVRCLASLAALTCLFTPGAAPNPVGAQENAGDVVLQGRPRRTDTLDYITIDVREKPLRDVLQGIGRQVDMNIVADPEIDETVTVNLDSIEWRKALEVIARQTHCKIIYESARFIRFIQPPPISIEFKDADLNAVLELLAKQSGANIVVSSDVEGKISLSLRDVPWRDALDTIVKTAGYVTVQDTEGVTDIIRVVRPETLKEQLETRVFRLKYVRPPERYLAVMKDIEKQSIDRYGKTELQPEDEFTLLKALRKALSDSGEMDFDIETNTLIVKDVAPSLAEIEHIISELDVEPVLVQVDVTFISTSNDDILETGLKFDLPGTPAREGVEIVMSAPEPLTTVGARESFAGVLNPKLERGGTYPFDLGRWETLRSGFAALGVLDFTQTQILLKMVKDDENSKVIQKPSLTTLDNHPSTIFVGDSVPFAVQRVKTDQNGNVQVEIDENDRSPINVGFTLYISPHVIPGTDTVHINVIPKVSTLTGTTSPVGGFDRFQFALAGSTNVNFIDLPRESAQTVVTYLRVQSGHTAIIGGLHTETKVEAETKVPVISSIPILGNLFRWKSKTSTVQHLMILITPKVIANTEMSDALYQEAIAEAEKYDYFLKKYGKPEEKSPAPSEGEEETPGDEQK